MLCRESLQIRTFVNQDSLWFLLQSSLPLPVRPASPATIEQMRECLRSLKQSNKVKKIQLIYGGIVLCACVGEPIHFFIQVEMGWADLTICIYFK